MATLVDVSYDRHFRFGLQSWATSTGRPFLVPKKKGDDNNIMNPESVQAKN
jgi:hypothetical protein